MTEYRKDLNALTFTVTALAFHVFGLIVAFGWRIEP
jgi:hypothetical protein